MNNLEDNKLKESNTSIPSEELKSNNTAPSLIGAHDNQVKLNSSINADNLINMIETKDNHINKQEELKEEPINDLSGAKFDTKKKKKGIDKRSYQKPAVHSRKDFQFNGYNVVGGISYKLQDRLSTIKTIKLPKGIQEISTSAFSSLPNLEMVILPKSLERINRFAFLGCPKLKQIDLPKELKIIENGAFQDCVELEDIVFPKTLMEVKGLSFYGCKKLKNVLLNENLKIGPRAFDECPNLKQVIEPMGVEHHKDAYDRRTLVSTLNFIKDENIKYKGKSIAYSKMDKPLFSKEEIETKSLNYEEVKQYNLGDCSIVSGISSVAEKNPEAIFNCMRDNGDGTVDVELYKPNKLKQIYKIQKSTNKEVGLGDDSPLWASILEKAILLYVPDSLQVEGTYDFYQLAGKPSNFVFAAVLGKETQTEGLSSKQFIGYTHLMQMDSLAGYLKPKIKTSERTLKALKCFEDLSLNGGFNDIEDIKANLFKNNFLNTQDEVNEFVDELILNLDKDYDKNVLYANDLDIYNKNFSGLYRPRALKTYESIKSLLQKKQPIVASTFMYGTESEHIFNGLASTHAYSLLDTKEEKLGEKTIKFLKLRNPWGKLVVDYNEDISGKETINLPNQKNGEMYVELNHFMKRFGQILYPEQEDDVVVQNLEDLEKGDKPKPLNEDDDNFDIVKSLDEIDESIKGGTFFKDKPLALKNDNNN